MECGHERLSFDEYSTLSLPLPESSLINFKLVINLLPEDIKFILQADYGVLDNLNLIDAEETHSKRHTLNFDQHEEQLLLLTKERSLQVPIQMMPS